MALSCDTVRRSESVSPAAFALAERGVRASVVRLPRSTHGAGERHGFVPMLAAVAREKGVSAYVGDGENRWPAVHRLDAARLFRLALEGAPAGSVLHGVAEEGVPVREVAEAVGAGLGVPVRSLTAQEAMAHFGWLGPFAGYDMPASSARTRERLGWAPAGPGLLEDLRNMDYGSAAA